MATKKKPCKCKGPKVGYGPIRITAGTWAINDVWPKVLEASEDGHYIYLDLLGIPPCIPTPTHPCPKN